MKTVMEEFHRVIRILRRFAGDLIIPIALSAAGTGVGLSLFVVGQRWDLGSLSILGEAILVGSVGYAIGRAIVAEFVAIARIYRWGKFGRD